MNYRKPVVTLFALIALLALAVPAFAGAPNFGPAIYADGDAYGTKGLSELPAPNDSNAQSFDHIYVFGNGADGQLPIAEAAPGNPDYNGGRWAVQSTTWTDAGLAAHGDDLPVLTSDDELMVHVNLGHIEVSAAGVYFECPLLPVK